MIQRRRYYTYTYPYTSKPKQLVEKIRPKKAVVKDAGRHFELIPKKIVNVSSEK
jgi:hypothetical protein